MKLFLDCLPCMLRQVLEAARMAADDEMVQEKIMNEAVKRLSLYKEYSNAPKLCEDLHAIVKKYTNIKDPYCKIKERDISQALKLEPIIREFVLNKGDMFINLLKVSATGNVMDSAMNNNLDIESCLSAELEKPFAVCHNESFKNDLKNSKNILFIGDNAGEAVFDKILIEYLSKEYKVIYAVRDKPIINDATINDAVKAGVKDFADIISTGCSSPGAVLEDCNEEFCDIFNNAHIVISKGQGNFEALSETSRKVYFLLKAKCYKIADAFNININEYVFKSNI
ncbi:damage-control phosphatase ARMT1 family protein [Anaerovorax odorimutans]|uniref:damage-control phosphatase ARMT1 family protein n=1 Tax=Anaerovorax odorimutans TaxID=109327 RepID=UPI00041FC5C0|nr:ARMT1-like domain-containing protein [Anaerovorax odorimutans]